MDSRKEKLIRIVGEKNIFDHPETLEVSSLDQSFVRAVNPRCLVKRRNVVEVQGISKLANRTRTPLVPVRSGPQHFRDYEKFKE